MRHLQTCLIILFLCASCRAQEPPKRTKSLVEVLIALPSQVSSKTLDYMEYTNTLEAQVTEEKIDFEAVVPLIRQYLRSPNQELRRYALLAVCTLARRPNSASELAPVLSDLNDRLSEQDIHMRYGAVLAIQTIQPSPPDTSVLALVSALRNAGASDDFGINLAETLVQIKPGDASVEDALLEYLHNPALGEERKAAFIEAVARPQLGESITRELVAFANTSGRGRLRDAAIRACGKVGPRAVSMIRARLAAIAADPAETAESRSTAVKVLDDLPPK